MGQLRMGKYDFKNRMTSTSPHAYVPSGAGFIDATMENMSSMMICLDCGAVVPVQYLETHATFHAPKAS